MPGSILARRLQSKRIRELKGETLQQTVDRLQRADYTLNTGAGSPVGELSAIGSAEEANAFLDQLLTHNLERR